MGVTQISTFRKGGNLSSASFFKCAFLIVFTQADWDSAANRFSACENQKGRILCCAAVATIRTRV